MFTESVLELATEELVQFLDFSTQMGWMDGRTRCHVYNHLEQRGFTRRLSAAVVVRALRQDLVEAKKLAARAGYDKPLDVICLREGARDA